NSGYIRERLDDRPYYHPLATLSYLEATTRRVSLGTSVLVLPYHNPVELAKYAASLDQMSGGRVVLGVGVGAMTEEFESLGVPFNQRGALTNESMAIMRELWTSPDPHYKSDRWNLSGFKFAPKPAQKPAIPLWVGGSSPGALRRAATMGDGRHPSVPGRGRGAHRAGLELGRAGAHHFADGGHRREGHARVPSASGLVKEAPAIARNAQEVRPP